MSSAVKSMNQEQRREKKLFISNHQSLDVVQADLESTRWTDLSVIHESRMNIGDAFTNVHLLDHDLDPWY